jgi:hypothetical protein
MATQARPGVYTRIRRWIHLLRVVFIVVRVDALRPEGERTWVMVFVLV